MNESSNPLEVMRRREQKDAFSLEVHRVRMNLEHLLERYREEVAALVRTKDTKGGPKVNPDRSEAQAIQCAIDIYQHVRAYQRGERRHPFASR